MIDQFYPIKRQLYKANSSDAKETSLAFLFLAISNGIISSKVTPTMLILTL